MSLLVSFDPSQQEDARRALDIIIAFHGVAFTGAAETAPVPNEPVAEVPVQETVAAAAVPASPTATPGAVDPQAGVELDANGTPWSAEVHAGTKTKTTKGVWKGKRGLDKAVIAAKEQQLRDTIATTPAATIPTAPVVAPTEMPQPVVTIEEVSAKWMACVQDQIVDGAQFQAHYDAAGVDGTQLAVNETMRVNLSTYLDRLRANFAPAEASPVSTALPGM